VVEHVDDVADDVRCDVVKLFHQADLFDEEPRSRLRLEVKAMADDTGIGHAAA